MAVAAVEAVGLNGQIWPARLEQALLGSAHGQHQAVGVRRRPVRIEDGHTGLLGITGLSTPALPALGLALYPQAALSPPTQPSAKAPLQRQRHGNRDDARQPPREAGAEASPQRGQPQDRKSVV